MFYIIRHLKNKYNSISLHSDFFYNLQHFFYNIRLPFLISKFFILKNWTRVRQLTFYNQGIPTRSSKNAPQWTTKTSYCFRQEITSLPLMGKSYLRRRGMMVQTEDRGREVESIPHHPHTCYLTTGTRISKLLVTVFWGVFRE